MKNECVGLGMLVHAWNLNIWEAEDASSKSAKQDKLQTLQKLYNGWSIVNFVSNS